ncbi:prepilin-type cleavage/methylation domain-containing protein [Marinobacter vulgaris]|uniref:Type II secretion system protein H n=1 Tax=Marinobacter vulgaris TaxID=1928331 RepID=A0A2V3ZFS7_9GAMM|nr:GspH/FimT family pseudopilin [Marinobacter vulgaris]PXX89378.1 prepilin-type cleavage/methylation domain-containing protein [Marinobacter vulgaris]TSJ68198.1 prepilin-type N-terminal cleavage/methylation domain-containing protein [Marinobacter vulgaris]
MIPSHIQRGFTLLELMIVVAVVAVITASVSGTWKALIERHTRYAVQSTLSQAFASARSSAVTVNEITTVCPLDENQNCSQNWDLPITVFLDPMNARALTVGTEVIRVFDVPDNGFLTASNSGQSERRYFQYNANGTARGTLGNLIWCPISHNPSGAIQLRMNFGGRITWARDSDEDGVKENSQGQPLVCP